MTQVVQVNRQPSSRLNLIQLGTIALNNEKTFDTFTKTADLQVNDISNHFVVKESWP